VGVAHVRRERFHQWLPVHVTLRLMPRLWGLRRPKVMRAVAQAVSAAAERFETRICHFSVQHNHIHLIVEAASNEGLSRAMQGLSTRLAIALNRLRGEHGKVFADRYHAHVLRTPTEVRRAVTYVLDNHVKHSGGARRGPDFYSSAVWPVVVAPKTWLLSSAGRSSRCRESRLAPPPRDTSQRRLL
jgi:REP element-mobilizing transposase RayT